MDSRFATEEEVFSPEFWSINEELLEINKEYDLQDHTQLNTERFVWASRIKAEPVYYASRMWEYPFAILAAQLEKGLTCADIGCGSTPFTAYLVSKVGAENVTGFDPDYIDNDEVVSHSSFGARKSFIEQVGFQFQPDTLPHLNTKDESFDRVFCISVLEHIPEYNSHHLGVQEMTRILKPGGRLIITMDLGLNNVLTNPLDVIKFSGLVPLGGLNLRWPVKRFARYPDTTMDVFGLVLEKSEGDIYADYNQSKSLPLHRAYHKFVETAENYSLPYSMVLMAKEMQLPLGPLRVWIKSLLGKYR